MPELSARSTEAAVDAAWAQWAQARESWRSWFLEKALPLWRSKGIDHQRGGFHEKLDGDGQPIDEPRRTRVVARQLYVLATAPQLGCTQDLSIDLDQGLNFLLRHLLSERGTFHAAYSLSEARPDTRFDLYEQAFALFALGSLFEAHVPELSTPRGRLQAIAHRTLEQMQAGWAHPVIGFQETAPPSVPLRANPHMHLLEAALCWQRATTREDEPWSSLVHQLIDLCLHHLVQPASGLVTELFDLDWCPAPGAAGSAAEPGHQFEWGWLLLTWANQDPDHPLAAQAIQAASRMIEQGEALGIDTERGVAINGIDASGQVLDASAKLWPQTERVKAWVAMARQAVRSGPEGASDLARTLTHATAAIRGLTRYLQHPVDGAWHESLAPDGRWQVQDIRASSLYHIVCALDVACGLPNPGGQEVWPQNTSASFSSGAAASFGANNNPC